MSSRSSSIKLFLQKTRLLSLANRIYNEVQKRVPQQLEEIPIYFLGETLISPEEWDRRYSQVKQNLHNVVDEIASVSIPASPVPDPPVCVIVSLYQSDPYLDDFCLNLKTQTLFTRAEVVIVSVLPSAYASEKLRSEFDSCDLVKIIEVPSLIGIYTAWNLAIKSSIAPYITNMNVDDMRHPRSLEIQLHEIHSSNADVVFQDVYYSLSHGLSWKEISAMNVRSNLPDVSLRLLARGINCPHNAPMYRRSLHEKIGYFDESFKSAGDHEFWIRAALNDASFKKSEHIHVSYFINPKGMSTKIDSPGATEGAQLLLKYRNYA